MAYRPAKCQLPYILRKINVEPVDFYTSLGWSKQQYSAYVNNRKYMSIATLKTVAEMLGLPMDDIYSWHYVKRVGNKQSE
jgi:hypothetical protein